MHREKVPKIAIGTVVKLGVASLRGALTLGVAFFLSPHYQKKRKKQPHIFASSGKAVG